MSISKDKKFIFLSCGSRGGAALTSAILNAHSCISVSTDKIKFFSFIKERYPKVNAHNIEKILTEFKLRLDVRWGIPFDVNMFKSIIGSDFSHSNLYQAFMLSIYKMDRNSDIIGECENMSWNHTDFFLNEIPNSKAFSIIRDPRDVLYSFKKNTIAKGNDYLINVFNTKGLMQSSINNIKKYKKKFYIVKFEKLKTNEVKEVKKICKFLDIKFETCMLKSQNWKELHGKGWRTWENKKTSSFYNDEKFHNPVERWRSKIDPVDHFIVEWVLKKEMKKLGYSLEFKIFNHDIFTKAIKRLTSSNLLVEAFSNFLLEDVGSLKLPLDRYNPNNWEQETIKKKNQIKILAKLMGY